MKKLKDWMAEEGNADKVIDVVIDDRVVWGGIKVGSLPDNLLEKAHITKITTAHYGEVLAVTTKFDQTKN